MIRQLKRLREILGTEATTTQCLALLVIDEYGKGDWLTISCLAELCGVSPHAASRAANYLIDSRLVESVEGGDKRTKVLTLSEFGEQEIQKLES